MGDIKKIILFPSIGQSCYNVTPTANPFNNFQIFQMCIGLQVRHWDIKQGIWFLFLLDNNALLDAKLGAPNSNINNFLIIKSNNKTLNFNTLNSANNFITFIPPTIIFSEHTSSTYNKKKTYYLS
ncbi:hypothetical protein [Candidatus Nitrosocosmicus arcticus]|uniref:hypothetical protein n=1 Tax=Candidatus Nitrosocosmicus arcticus TaxID=2035267 RepID=UPI0011AA1B87|nr:hypothetical protein [Candidatus Nitrosocosmicus arcticus]